MAQPVLLFSSIRHCCSGKELRLFIWKVGYGEDLACGESGVCSLECPTRAAGSLILPLLWGCSLGVFNIHEFSRTHVTGERKSFEWCGQFCHPLSECQPAKGAGTLPSPLSLTFSGLSVREPLAHAVGVYRVTTHVFQAAWLCIYSRLIVARLEEQPVTVGKPAVSDVWIFQGQF